MTEKDKGVFITALPIGKNEIGQTSYHAVICIGEENELIYVAQGENIEQQIAQRRLYRNISTPGTDWANTGLHCRHCLDDHYYTDGVNRPICPVCLRQAFDHEIWSWMRFVEPDD